MYIYVYYIFVYMHMYMYVCVFTCICMYVCCSACCNVCCSVCCSVFCSVCCSMCCSVCHGSSSSFLSDPCGCSTCCVVCVSGGSERKVHWLSDNEQGNISLVCVSSEQNMGSSFFSRRECFAQILQNKRLNSVDPILHHVSGDALQAYCPSTYWLPACRYSSKKHSQF